MLFHSFVFIFAFLPVVILCHRLALRFGGAGAAMAALAGASFFFYGWWNPPYLLIFLASIVFNFLLGSLIRKARRQETGRRAWWLTAFGVGANLLTLGYFKYLGFLLENLSPLFGTVAPVTGIILPIGISFYTFQQIAYLVDNYQRPIPDASFVRYSLFVSFFPQLIAGPIVHHREMMPQFRRRSFASPAFSMIATGMLFFAIGLFKKLAIADNLSPIVMELFEDALEGKDLEFWQSWAGAIAYTLQIYFDFSGYSDMAIGLGLFFGIRLPINFYSPYKATSIIDFWRRWHITLSRFLRDYIYIPMGGNRRGRMRRHANLLVTMLLGGLWHGANWTFVGWGALHGVLLAVNHLWRRFRPPIDFIPLALRRLCSIACTFLTIAVLWVFFRAPDFSSARAVLAGMAGFNGAGWSSKREFGDALLRATELEPAGLVLILAGLIIVFLAPNSIEIGWGIRLRGLSRLETEMERRRHFVFRPSLAWAVAVGLLTAAAFWAAPEISEFIYFQF